MCRCDGKIWHDFVVLGSGRFAKKFFCQKTPPQVVRRPNARQHFYVLRWRIAETTQESLSRQEMRNQNVFAPVYGATLILVHRSLNKNYCKSRRQKLKTFSGEIFFDQVKKNKVSSRFATNSDSTHAVG